MKNSNGRWVSVGTAAHVLGVTPTLIGNMVADGKLARRGEPGFYRFDVVELVKLRASRAARGVRAGRRTVGEAMAKATADLRKRVEGYDTCL